MISPCGFNLCFLMISDVEQFSCVGHLSIFFGEMSVHVFCPFFDWIAYFGGIELDKLFIGFEY